MGLNSDFSVGVVVLMSVLVPRPATPFRASVPLSMLFPLLGMLLFLSA